MCSASTTALRTSSAAAEGSEISPLRTPRERDCPRPMIFRAPEALTSPTTAQTLDVPISRPTMIEDDGSNIFLPVRLGLVWFRGCRGKQARFQPASREVVRDRKIQRSDLLAVPLTVIVHAAPTAQLPVEVVQAKGYGAALPASPSQNIGRRQINSPQAPHPPH